jgi:hypothetical protein
MLGISLKRWNWVDDGVIPLTAIVMSAAWGYPLFALFLRNPRTGAGNPGFSFWICLGLLLAAFAAGRLASGNRMGPIIVIVGGLAAIVVLLMLTVPAGGDPFGAWFAGLFRFIQRGQETGEILPVPLVVIVFGTLFWVRGVRAASLDHNGAVSAFIIGVVAVSGLLLVAELLPAGAGVEPDVQSPFMQQLVGGLVPLFLISVPAAIVLAVLAPALGSWASTAGEVILVAGLVFLSMILPFGPDPREMVGWLLLFLASGLATLSLISVSTTLREQERMTGVSLRIDRYWVLIMAAVVASILILGLLVGQLVAPGLVLRLLGLLRPVWLVIRQVLLFIIMIFAYLFFSLLEPLLGELDQRSPTSPGVLLSPAEAEGIEDLTQEAAQLPPAFIVIMQILLVAGAVGVIALLFYMALRNREKREVRLDEVIETRETVLSMDLLQEQVRGLLDGLRRRSRSYFVELDPGEQRRRAVRDLYQRLLGYGINLDAPRLGFQTPTAYGPRFARLAPGAGDAVDVLTEIYVIARYGTEPPSVEQVTEAQAAYERIVATLNRTYELSSDAHRVRRSAGRDNGGTTDRSA